MLELIILGAIAVFIISKLYQVLGEKTGFENPGVAEMMSEHLNKKAFEKTEEVVEEKPDVKISDALQTAVETLKTFDPSFRVDWFLQGATKAFELLIDAFSKGDRTTLQNLMAPDVYQTFESALVSRKDNRQQLSTTIVKIDPVDIIAINIHENKAKVTVRFVSEQINILYAHDKTIVEGSPKQIEEVTDEWVFERNLADADPNWTVIDIKS